MLTALNIEDFGLIHHTQLTAGQGLCVVTGETGAGKSMLMDALGTVLGARAEKSSIRKGQTSAQVQASFSSANQPHVAAWLAENAIPPEDGEIFLRRALTYNASASGALKSQAFINGIRVTNAQLQEIGALLADIHGQRDQNVLLNPKQHVHLLDQFGQYHTAVNTTKTTYQTWKSIRKKLTEAEARLQDQTREENLLQAFLEELDNLNYTSGEEENLSTERTRLMQAEHTQSALHGVAHALQEGELLAHLQQAERALSGLEDNPRMANLSERFASLVIETQDISAEITQAVEEATPNPALLEQVDNRLQALRDTARKHRITIEDLPKQHEIFTSQLDDLSLLQEGIDDLIAKEKQAWEQFTKACSALSTERHNAAPALEIQIHTALKALHMPHTQLQVVIDELEEDAYSAQGAEHIHFELQVNPGTPFLPLEKVASGGEVSRLMLALKQVFCAKMQPMTLVFDEIDTGLGGAVADAVGDALQNLADMHQVFVITHQPQVAAKGSTHLKIDKLIEQNGDGKTTRTTLTELDATSRTEELARMLSGKNITAEARAAAQKLLAA